MGDEDVAAPGSWPGRTPSPHLKLLGDALKVAYTLATGTAWGHGGLYVIILDSKADSSRGRRTGKEREVSMTRHWTARTGHPRSPVVPACAGLRLHVLPRVPHPVPR